jgi:hypothetical protein
VSLVDSAVRHPTSQVHPRAPGSIRRTSHIDMLVGQEDPLVLAGARRDLLTARDDTTKVLSRVSVEATIGSGRRVRALVTDPGDERVEELVGAPVGRGFRARLDEVFGADAQSLELYSLLEELPVAALLSGYAAMYQLSESPATMANLLPEDVCSGWHHDGFMMTTIRQTGSIPLPLGPPDPISTSTDELAWHEMTPLPVGGMRRRRLVNLEAGDPAEIWAMFQDTHVGEDGAARVLHEYSVTASVDPETLEILHCRATPQVLPWGECPAAAQSAERLVGHRVGDIRSLLRAEFHGTSVCTHLNDLLRSLGDVATLSSRLDDALGGSSSVA